MQTQIRHFNSHITIKKNIIK